MLVFRLGGSSMDATIMNVNSGMYSVVNQKTNSKFGSKDFDKSLVDNLAQEFKRYIVSYIKDLYHCSIILIYG